MQNDINTIIKDALLVDKNNLKDNIRNIIKDIKKSIDDSKVLILETNLIDKKNNNGFIIDFNVIDNIFNNIKKEETVYGDVILSQKDKEKKIVYGRQIFDKGNVVVINEGNSYVILEMILRNILAGNNTIFCNEGYMYGTNGLLITLVQCVLEKYDVSKNLIQMYTTENYDEILNNFANIDLVVCIGNHNLQNLILNKSKVPVIVSGYENFEIYIDNNTNKEFIEKIISSGLNIEIYKNSEIEYEYEDEIVVDDIDEAIAQINYNGAKYASSIFTDSKENASKFINEVKSSIVTVNTTPSIERIIDIKQSDLYLEKKIIYPLENDNKI